LIVGSVIALNASTETGHCEVVQKREGINETENPQSRKGVKG
jgi:hypothetical protein